MINTTSNATDMRQYLAIAYARLDVSVADREMFYKHLGHSQNMNENVRMWVKAGIKNCE